MHPYPHTYVASAIGRSQGLVTVASPRLLSFETAAPPEFDGPGDVWSPETLLCASIADCFVLSFRALSRAARFEWLQLECRVEGVLERVSETSRFTRFTTFAELRVSRDSDVAKARELLERAEHDCPIANSLRSAHTVHAVIRVVSAASDVALIECVEHLV